MLPENTRCAPIQGSLEEKVIRMIRDSRVPMSSQSLQHSQEYQTVHPCRANIRPQFFVKGT